MELRQLKYFITVAEKLSFSKAAESLFITQSALSKQIMTLEQDLGVQLLERTRQSVRLTDAGRYLLANAKEIDGHVENVRHALLTATHTDEFPVALNVGITDMLLSIPMYTMAYLKTVEDMKQSYPDVRISLCETRMSQVKHDIAAHAIDMGIVVSEMLRHKDLSDINYRIFHRSKVYLITAKDSGLSPQADIKEIRDFLKEKNVYMFEQRPRIHMQGYEICMELDARPKSISTMRNPRLLTKIAQGEGVTFSRIGEYEEYMKDELSFTRLPIPSGEMISMFAWNDTNSMINDFFILFEKHLLRLNEKAWRPMPEDCEQYGGSGLIEVEPK